MFTHPYRYLFITGLAVYTYINTVLCQVYTYFHINVEWYYALLTIFLVTLFTWEGNRLLEAYIKRISADNNTRYLVGFFLVGILVATSGTILVVFFIGQVLHGYSFEENIQPYKLNIIYCWLVNLFFHLLNAIFFFFRQYRTKLIEAEELKRANTQAQLQAIKSQINPHFLFNSLNVLSGMVVKDNPDANKYIEDFSKVYRYVLNNQEKELVPLADELEFVKPYIALLEKRFPESLRVDISIPEKYSNHYIIPVALQMLIENAIKHNIVSRNKPLHIDIHANGNNTLIVRNNLQPRQSNEYSSRLGLQNITKRYELISGLPVMVEKSDEAFEVTIPLLRLN